MNKPTYHSSRLYQTDLFDQVKSDGNHIICLCQSQTKSFFLIASLRNRAYTLHQRYGSRLVILIEPDREHADERQRVLYDHSELKVLNLFHVSDAKGSLREQRSQAEPVQIVIASLDHMLANLSDLNDPNTTSMVIFDYAHLLLLHSVKMVEDIVKAYKGIKLLAIMCSLVHNNQELTPINTVQLISHLETIFEAKCETSGDLRSLSRQSHVTNVDIIIFNPSELVICDWVLMADNLLKEFCQCILDSNLDSSSPLVQPEPGFEDVIVKGPLLSANEQLVLVRSCLSDVIYSLLCLGLWCAKKTIKMYLTEFSILLKNEQPAGDLIGAAQTILNTFYGRLDETINYYTHNDPDADLVLDSATQQLRFLLDSIKENQPAGNNNWPICIVHVKRRVIAKVMALWLDKVASSKEEYSFIRPNYIVGSARKHRNRMAVDNFDLHHEASIREFRFGDCNVLITAAAERCSDIPRCNLVVSFDLPQRFSDFIQAKGNCRYDSSKYVTMINPYMELNSKQRLLGYVNMERLLNDFNKRHALEAEETALLEALETKHEPFPSKTVKNPATIYRSIGIINKYCSKLPSDSFTKLSPEYNVVEIVESDGTKKYFCKLRLPINSPVRQIIIGPEGPTRNIAVRLGAFYACKVLYDSRELDISMLPITKESMKLTSNNGGQPRKSIHKSKRQPVGSTKHRQYYKKMIAQVFSGPQVSEGINCYLYKFKMVLTCPLPDEQNRRGRRIIDPGETNRNYAIVCTSILPKISSFPVFTRSGEVLIGLELIETDFTLTKQQVDHLRMFHKFTFSKVLRLEKYPTSFDPDRSEFTVLLAPVIDLETETKIDWKFVSDIVENDCKSHVPGLEDRKNFKFNKEDYVDAVVIPWYRMMDRQQFAYYVAEICTDLNPFSDFPDEDSGFKTFVDYYRSKYDIEIYNADQPILDVDHTSARLNLLTPRYVNRKGITLPSSTAKTRRESRESLIQKQLLIPELCSIHPFPASFWRKAVCLPCIFYRLNSLFLAEELRKKVAQETGVGFVNPEPDFEWPQLDFGWSLKDIIQGQSSNDSEVSPIIQKKSLSRKCPPISKDAQKSLKSKVMKKDVPKEDKGANTTAPGCDFVIDHFDPSKYEIPDIPLDSPSGDWMNIKLISSCTDASTSLNSGPSGWDQPLEQHDLMIEHIPETTWSDCEMNFEGEITERIGGVRCGSPSAFESQQSFNTGGDLNSSGSNREVSFILPPQKIDDIQSDDHQYNEALELDDGKEDISWSASDDEDVAVDEIETANSARSYGAWKDSKAKNSPLLRELFLPTARTNESLSNEIDSLFITIRDHFKDVAVDESRRRALTSNTIHSLETKGPSNKNSTQRLIELLNCDSLATQLGGIRLVVDEDQIEESLTSWHELMKKLSAKVDLTLLREKDLFKDNAIELVTVDDSFQGRELELQPTFGELLPNREVASANLVNDKWKQLKFDPIKAEIKSIGPGPNVILQALTMSNASDGINLERLETVGDSFLKYSITAYLYCMYPTMHEGKLSYLRSTEISNANLYELGRAKNLAELMSATKFEPNDNWLPPGYTVAANPTVSKGADLQDEDQQLPSGGNKKREIDKALAEVPYDLLLQHSIPDKSVADCVEALIGAYLTASGSRAALLFMRWLGLKVMPPNFDLEADINQCEKPNFIGEEIWTWLDIPQSPLICRPTSCDPSVTERVRVDKEFKRKIGVVTEPDEIKQLAMNELERLYYGSNLDKFEKEINYTFKDKSYLVQAFTHNSFYENHVTDCHQRLEFLGDALLDYLITRYLFEDPRCHSPGTLTDLRSALVNNTFFASLAVKYKFHKYLQFISDELFNVIDGFVKKFRFDLKDTITKGYTLLISEGESEYAEDIEVPKALGDVFESVAGAIYLDSGMSLDQVWRVYFRMMKPEIEYFSSNVPRSPIRELLESMPQNVRFSPSELAPDRKHRVIAEVFGLGRFTGVGRNKHSAKSTAAKRALRMLALQQRSCELRAGQ